MLTDDQRERLDRLVTVPTDERESPVNRLPDVFSQNLKRPIGLEVGHDGVFDVRDLTGSPAIELVLRLDAIPERASSTLIIGGLSQVGVAARCCSLAQFVS